MRIRWWRLVGAGGWWWGRPVCPHASHESRDRRASAHTMTAARWYDGLTDPHCPAGSAADAALKVAGTGGALRHPSARPRLQRRQRRPVVECRGGARACS